MDSYYNILHQKTIDSKSEQPSLIDLSMYLIMLEILLHLIAHKESIEKENTEKHLLQIPLSKKVYSWSKYLIQYIGMFTMWCNQKNGFKDFDSTDYSIKLQQYKSMAFKTNLSALAIYNNVNKTYDNNLQGQWLILSLLNSNLVFNSANSYYPDTEEFISFIPQNVLDELGESIIEDEILNNLAQLNSLKAKIDNHAAGDFYYHSEIGYTYLDKVIQNSKNTFYKLFTPGFEWDEKVNNYWNGHLFSINENRWLKSKRN